MSLFDILEALMAYNNNQIRFLQAKEAILNGDANDKNRGNQMTGPGCLQIVLRGVNWLISPIIALCTLAFQNIWKKNL